MKKYLLMIVLFTVGQMCKAQSSKLVSKDCLKPTTETRKMTVKQPRKAEVNTKNYWGSMIGYYDEWGNFSTDNTATSSTQPTVTFNGTDVTFLGLVDYGWFTPTEEYEIHGTYDANAKTITIQTPGYSEEKKENDYTVLAHVNVYGEPCYLPLLAGDFATEPDENGQYGLNTVDELVFDVSDDLSTLTARTGYGTYAFTIDRNMGQGFLTYYKSATFNERSNEAHIAPAESEMLIEGLNVTAGATVKKNVKLSNIGMTDAYFDWTIEGEGIDLLAGDNFIEAGNTKEYELLFEPTKEGEQNGKINIITENGATETINIKANVLPAPDFSPIVKQGEMIFSFGDDMPFILTSEETGFPVAMSSNGNENYGSSSLKVNLSIPEGKVGLFSFKGISNARQTQSAYMISLDGGGIDSNFGQPMNTPFADDVIDNTMLLEAGNHTIEFYFQINTNSYLYGWIDRPYRMYVYDLDLTLQDITTNSAYLKTESVDFGANYFDKTGCNGKQTVKLLNTGTEPLEVLSISQDGPFAGIVDGAKAQYQQDLDITLTFNAEQAGEYTGNVVITTTGGDFTVSCSGVAEQIPTDYQPIVTQGEFSFDTDHEHPFILDGNKAYSSTAYAGHSNGKLVSWLDAYFEVPEGKQAVISWTGVNSSADWLYFMGDKAFNDGTRIIIDDETERDFCGNDPASSNQFDESELTFTAGKHKVRFLYEKILSTPAGDDMFTVSNLSLTMSDYDAIETVENNVNTIATEIYSVAGKRMNKMQKGINIVKQTLADGSVKTKKVIIK